MISIVRRNAWVGMLRRVSRASVSSKSSPCEGKVTPFVGEKLKYCIRKTFLRGAEVLNADTRKFTRVPVRHVR